MKYGTAWSTKICMRWLRHWFLFPCIKFPLRRWCQLEMLRTIIRTFQLTTKQEDPLMPQQAYLYFLPSVLEFLTISYSYPMLQKLPEFWKVMHGKMLLPCMKHMPPAQKWCRLWVDMGNWIHFSMISIWHEILGFNWWILCSDHIQKVCNSFFSSIGRYHPCGRHP